MRRIVNIVLSIGLIIVSLAVVIPSLAQEDYPKAVVWAGLLIRCIGMLADEYQLKWAKKVGYTGLAIAAVGAVYALYAYFM